MANGKWLETAGGSGIIFLRHCSQTMEMTATILFSVCLFVSLWRNKRLVRRSSLQHRGYRWYGRLFGSSFPFCVCTQDDVPSDAVPQEHLPGGLRQSLSRSSGVLRRRVWLHWAAGILCAKITPLGQWFPWAWGLNSGSLARLLTWRTLYWAEPFPQPWVESCCSLPTKKDRDLL